MLENYCGQLFVISGPSGVGKGTIIDELLKTRKDIVVSISYTSRSPRAGEQDGVNYYFVDRREFENMIKKDDFLEYAEVHGNYYGTSLKKVRAILSDNKKIIFEVDIKGGMNLKRLYPSMVTIFILPPNNDEIIKRINKRGTETQETMRIRLETMKSEMQYSDKYDHRVINDDLSQTLKEINEILDKKKKG